ncbi:MAG: hypothetical protein BGO89_07685 [Candidatus Kapaibacterium thiocyanatum]|uniref:Uncharacterized protein n=1 Tax=Candidatus Kapaibacterium thiocyanatum TaxID=1895771 RepID=A0A1M3KZC9_9BACT|nr:MAG: hypothetical protein BGO89_07685 ['Candidatus Kapabacteria' thiocyanatum]
MDRSVHGIHTGYCNTGSNPVREGGRILVGELDTDRAGRHSAACVRSGTSRCSPVRVEDRGKARLPPIPYGVVSTNDDQRYGHIIHRLLGSRWNDVGMSS